MAFRAERVFKGHKRNMDSFLRGFILVLCSVWVMPAMAGSLDSDIAHFKGQVADLNQDVFKLEQDILHPANTQIAVYLSDRAQNYFSLDSVELSIDGHSAVSYLYTDKERKALDKGGIQRLYVGNLSAGAHKISATLNGQGVNDHYFRKQADFTIQKGDNAKQVQLIITAESPSYEPAFKLKTWK